MKTLYLVRHAKTEEKGVDTDFTRELTSQGHKQALALAGHWKNKGYGVNFAMCSAAVRTEQTFEYLRDGLGTDDVLVSRNFYGIEEDEMLNYIRECGTQYDSLLYVGHNPGVAFFAMKLAKAPPEAMLDGYKPGSMCVFNIDIDDWNDLDWHMGDVTDYWTPAKSG